MPEQTNVLIATDMSAWAGKAEHRGANIAKTLPNGQAVLTYIQEQTDLDLFLKLMSGTKDIGKDEIIQGTDTALNGKAKELADKCGLPVTTVTRVGNIVEEVQDIIQQQKAVLLVIGKHGRGYHAMPIIGNTPVKLVQGCPCPVLVVQNDPDQQYKRILIPVDMTEAALDQTRQVLPFLPADAEITLIHVCHEPANLHGVSTAMMEDYNRHQLEEARKNMRQFLQTLGTGRTYKTHIIVGEPHRDIINYVRENNIDLLILGKKPRNRLQEYIIGSVVHTGLNEAECDVLVTPSMK